MRKYRLKKDTPTIKADTIFQEVISDYDKARELVRIMPFGSATSPQWTIDDINNFDEWFEEVKEFEEWRPKHGEGFKVMNIDGSVTDYYDWADSESDRFLLGTGNCYPLNTPDELIIKERKLIPQAMHRLKMAAKKAWFEFNGSEGPDWSDEGQKKYYIELSHDTNTLFVNLTYTHQSVGQVYFPTEESCQAYIDNNKDDIKLLFGVE